MNLILYYLFKGQVRDIDDFFPKGSQYAVAALLFYITILIWNFIICVFYEKKGLFYCTMGRTWKEYIKEWTDYIVCKVKQFIKWVVGIVMEALPGPIADVGTGLFDVIDITATAGGALLLGEDPVKAVKNKDKCVSDEEIYKAISDALEKMFKSEIKCEPV
jgi:hypothetical protein